MYRVNVSIENADNGDVVFTEQIPAQHADLYDTGLATLSVRRTACFLLATTLTETGLTGIAPEDLDALLTGVVRILQKAK
jgi:hypothetical protein